MDWRHRAVCRGVDPELFFPTGIGGPADAQIRKAKAVCARCPVITECRDWATGVLADGVAGGLTADERRTAARTRRLPTPA